MLPSKVLENNENNKTNNKIMAISKHAHLFKHMHQVICPNPPKYERLNPADSQSKLCIALPAALILQFLSLVLLSLQLCLASGFFLAEQGILGLQRCQLGLDGQQFLC